MCARPLHGACPMAVATARAARKQVQKYPSTTLIIQQSHAAYRLDVLPQSSDSSGMWVGRSGPRLGHRPNAVRMQAISSSHGATCHRPHTAIERPFRSETCNVKSKMAKRGRQSDSADRANSAIVGAGRAKAFLQPAKQRREQVGLQGQTQGQNRPTDAHWQGCCGIASSGTSMIGMRWLKAEAKQKVK